ncbi:MAG: MFS transporter [Actinobacteria bacterium]|nr:MFS transporter [Actinomycetota bacterium]
METTSDTGWRPVTKPPKGRRAGGIDWEQPFARLALVHVLSVMGETLVVLSLASSFFFNIDPSRGREKVILGLLFTMAPFAVIGPFIGPFIDRVRGGHRAVIRASLFTRAVVAALMVLAVVSDSPALFVEAFVMLVLAKTYQIVRAAVVPTTVAGELELVEANSKLQLLSSVGSTVAGLVGGACLLFGEPFLLTVTAGVFTAGGIAALRLNPSAVGAIEERENQQGLRVKAVVSPRLSVSAFAMGLVRLVVGFVTFLMAFELRGGGTVSLADRAANVTLESYRHFDPRATVPPLGDGPPMWYFGAVLVASVVGGLLGAMLAPKFRAKAPEHKIQLGGSLVAVAAATMSVLLPGLGGYVVLSFGTALAAALAKQAFDAAVQREVEESDRGQVFASYESRFQVAWVAGALIPAALPIGTDVGAACVVAIAGAAAMALFAGVRPVLTTVVDGKRQVKPTVARHGAKAAASNPDEPNAEGPNPDGPNAGGQASRSGKSGMSNGSSSSGND